MLRGNVGEQARCVAAAASAHVIRGGEGGRKAARPVAWTAGWTRRSQRPTSCWEATRRSRSLPGRRVKAAVGCAPAIVVAPTRSMKCRAETCSRGAGGRAGESRGRKNAKQADVVYASERESYPSAASVMEHDTNESMGAIWERGPLSV